MPIGKNAIKRITNNGYSSVKSSAPDMENSEVITEKEVVVEKKKPTAKKAIAKPAPKSEPKTEKAIKATATKKSAKAQSTPAKAPEKATEPTEAPKRQGNGYINLGGELPYYLL